MPLLPKTLKVHAGGGGQSNLERNAEVSFIAQHIKYALCQLALEQLGIVGFKDPVAVTELVEATYSFLLQFAAQCGRVSQLAGRRRANFLDILNGLYIADRLLYADFLRRSAINEFVNASDGNQQQDFSVLEAYASLRLNLPPKNPPLKTLEAPASFELVALKRLIQTYQQQAAEAERMTLPGEHHHHLPPPTLVNMDLTWSSAILLPSKPDAVPDLSTVVRKYTNRSQMAGMEKKSLTKLRDQLSAGSVFPSASFPHSLGVIKRPVGLAAEQQSIVKYVLANVADSLTSPTDELPLAGLPIPYPASCHAWEPVFPTLSRIPCRPSHEIETLSRLDPDNIDSAGGGEPQCGPEEKVSLQMELCAIEPDYPVIYRAQRESIALVEQEEVHETKA